MARKTESGAWRELRRISQLDDLPGASLRALSNVSVRRSYVPGRYISMEGRPAQSASLILSGKVNVFCTSTSGRKQVLARLGPGNWLGIVPSLEAGSMNPANVVALTPVKALVIAGSDLRRLLLDHPQLTLAVLDDLTDHVRHLWHVVEMLALLPTTARVARFILDHADADGFVHWRCTQEDIAARLGTVQDVVGRALRGFADKGLIEMPTRNCIVILDQRGLRIEAQR